MNISDSVLGRFNQDYAKIHGRIVFPLTIFGLLTSIVTIIVLHQKTFRTPTNLILQHVAFFDTVVLVSSNVYSFYFYILHQPNPFVGQPQFWPRFALFHSHIGLTAHSIALWLTCLLAIIRYTIISKPKQVIVNSIDVIILVWLVALIVCILMIPNYLLWNVVREPASKHLPQSYTSNSTETVYWLSAATGGRLEKITFAIIAICFKILPVFILIIFSVLLILNIHHARKLRVRLRRRYSSVSSSAASLKRELRTTTMLVLITFFTVLVEFPQGIFFIASGINTHFYSLYSLLGDIWELTSIVSSFITFIMYCLMSQQFRMEMYTLLLPTYLTKKFNLQTNEKHLTDRFSLRPRATTTHSILILPGTIQVAQNL